MWEIFEDYIPDLTNFLSIPLEEINRIVKESLKAVIDIIVMVMQALCTKLNLSKQDTEQCVEKVRTRNMGYLWENIEKIDVQGTYEALTQAKAALAAAEERAQNAEAENARLKALLTLNGIKDLESSE